MASGWIGNAYYYNISLEKEFFKLVEFWGPNVVSKKHRKMSIKPNYGFGEPNGCDDFFITLNSLEDRIEIYKRILKKYHFMRIDYLMSELQKLGSCHPDPDTIDEIRQIDIGIKNVDMDIRNLDLLGRIYEGEWIKALQDGWKYNYDQILNSTEQKFDRIKAYFKGYYNFFKPNLKILLNQAYNNYSADFILQPDK